MALQEKFLTLKKKRWPQNDDLLKKTNLHWDFELNDYNDVDESELIVFIL